MALGFNKPVAPKPKETASFDFDAAMQEGNEPILEDEAVENEVVESNSGKGHKGISPKYVVLGVGVVLLVGFVVLKLVGGKKPEGVGGNPAPTPTTVVSEPSTSYGNGDNTSDAHGVVGDDVVDMDKFTSDFEGNQVPLNYEVSSISFVNDMVNYEKFRATTGDGLELFWLDIIYKEKEYRAQVPYYIYVQLEDKGIIIVNMEVLTLSNGGTMITFMQVVSNYKELISQ